MSAKVTLEDVQFIFRNFAGAPTKFSRGQKVKPNTSVIVSPELAEELKQIGVNVRQGKPREDHPDDEVDYFVNVKFGFGGRSGPRVIMLVGDPETTKPRDMTRTVLDERTIGELDMADVVSADIVANTYEYNGNVTLYADTMYVVVRPSYLDEKYGMFDSEPLDDEFVS